LPHRQPAKRSVSLKDHAAIAADARIALPARAVTSLCFGGADLRDLYVVTADNTDDPARAGTIFRMRSDVAGLPAPLARI
jgi:gluconolactonase